MEREPQPRSIGLTVVAGVDYPEASEILVSFPDKWVFIDYVHREESALYVGAMPPEKERPRRQRFYGLPPALNETLNTYRLYKLFQPWPIPYLSATWDQAMGTLQVDGMRDLKVQLQPVGQAQVWHGEEDAVIWECYLHDTARRAADWQDELADFWKAVEKDIRVARFLTQPHEPAFEEGYTDFLEHLGYTPAYPNWWSKHISG